MFKDLLNKTLLILKEAYMTAAVHNGFSPNPIHQMSPNLIPSASDALQVKKHHIENVATLIVQTTDHLNPGIAGYVKEFFITKQANELASSDQATSPNLKDKQAFQQKIIVAPGKLTGLLKDDIFQKTLKSCKNVDVKETNRLFNIDIDYIKKLRNQKDYKDILEESFQDFKKTIAQSPELISLYNVLYSSVEAAFEIPDQRLIDLKKQILDYYDGAYDKITQTPLIKSTIANNIVNISKERIPTYCMPKAHPELWVWDKITAEKLLLELSSPSRSNYLI